MGLEIDLLAKYPRPKRDTQQRAQAKTEEDRQIARRFGQEFFDGERRHGYGGFTYHPRFWQPVVSAFCEHFQLKAGDTLLDVGCAKGFMLHDFAELIPGLQVAGIDISEYAIENVIEDMQPFCQVADARKLPFADKTFDVVVSINTVHNLNRAECIVALQEIERMARRGSFITVDAYRTDAEKEAMLAWNLTGQTVLHVDDWKVLFNEAGYTGDYFWFMP
jgi:SAM-dependent methyltransferase